jgi:hypothetical protein
MFNFFHVTPKQIYGPLKEISDEDSLEILEDAENIDSVALAGACAEVLRRMIKTSSEHYHSADERKEEVPAEDPSPGCKPDLNL